MAGNLMCISAYFNLPPVEKSNIVFAAFWMSDMKKNPDACEQPDGSGGFFRALNALITVTVFSVWLVTPGALSTTSSVLFLSSL